jgi:drug/metabolite transporter (DMT)-like permease
VGPDYSALSPAANDAGTIEGSHAMDLFVFIAVVIAAACHAGWNALLKLKVEPIIATTLVAMASALVVVPFAFLAGLPHAAAWPCLVASVAVHIGYYLALAEAYRHGDLGQVYPIARGTAPLLTALVATLVLGEILGSFGWAGIIALTSGILLLAVRGGRHARRFNARSVGFALLTSLTITTYTVVDGIGARIAGSAAYTVWLFLLSGTAMGIYGVIRVGPQRLIDESKANWAIALGGAALSTAAYAIAIWAMTVAPIALVAALRESSVLFATLISTLLLREPWLAARIAATLFVLAGALLLRVR